MSNKDNNKLLVKEIKKHFDDSELVVFTSFSGLSVEADTELRSSLRAVNAQYKV